MRGTALKVHGYGIVGKTAVVESVRSHACVVRQLTSTGSLP